MTTTEGRIYLVNTVTLERLEYQFIPLELSYSHEADVNEVKIIGRNEPKYHSTGGKTTMPLKLDFFSMEENREDVIRKVKWLETLAMSDGYGRSQPRIKVVFGRLFRDELWVVKDVRATFKLFNRAYGMLPQQAEVTLNLLRDANVNTKWQETLWG